MKRLLVAAAFAATLLVGAGTATAAEPIPTPTPGVPSEIPSEMPSMEPSAAPTVSLDPNTAQVCAKSRETVTNGINAFTDEINNAGELAVNGDLMGAEKSVKQSGTILIDLAGQLRNDATGAERQELKDALNSVAAELDSLGGDLNSLTSLQNFDTQRLETLAERVAQLCGG